MAVLLNLVKGSNHSTATQERNTKEHSKANELNNIIKKRNAIYVEHI